MINLGLKDVIEFAGIVGLTFVVLTIKDFKTRCKNQVNKNKSIGKEVNKNE